MSFLLPGTNHTFRRVSKIVTLYFVATGFDSLQVTLSNFFIFFLSTRELPKQYINTEYDCSVPYPLTIPYHIHPLTKSSIIYEFVEI
jgi:hypothetical protein